MQQEIILTVGLPASGKSTWADEFVQNHPEYMIINRDDIRLMLQGRARYNKFGKLREQLVTDTQIESASFALASNYSVIVSDTNLNPGTIEKWETFAKCRDIPLRNEMFTDTPLGVCLERDKKRKYPVGSKVITGMFEKYRHLYWPRPKFNTYLESAIIVDVDGTIAEMHKRHPFEWDKVSTDLPKMDVINVVNTMSRAGTKVIVCSGRDGVCETDTAEWMMDNGVEFDFFYIRPAGDNRKDYDIKQEIYENHIKGKYNIIGVFDDRDQVVHLWRHLGLTCFQVNYGSF